jgi:ribonuclease Z
MQVVFLGTGGYHPNGRRETAGVLLPELGLLLDAGTGLYRLPKLLQRRELTVALTHAHLDHVCGLTYLLGLQVRREIDSLTILGRHHVLDAVRTHLFAEPIFPVPLTATWTALDDLDHYQLDGDARLTFRELVSHPGHSLGYRVAWPMDDTDCAGRGTHRSLAYITDTTVDGSYTEFVRGVDLLIHECSFPDSLHDWADRTGHSHASQVAELAAAASVSRLVVTHIDPRRLDADPVGLGDMRGLFPATEIAADELVIDV